MQKNLRTLVIAFVVLSIAPILAAQETVTTDRLRATAPTFFGETGLFQTTSGNTLEKGEWSFGAYLNESRYLIAPGEDLIRPDSAGSGNGRAYRDKDLVEDRFSVSLGYGITDRWEVDLLMPYVNHQGNANDLVGYKFGYPYDGKINENNIGNLHLGSKFGLLSEDSPFDLAITAFLDFNTGHEDSGIATGNTDYGLGFALNRGIFFASTHYNNRGQRDSSNSPSGKAFSVANEFHADFGLNIPLNILGQTNWITEVNTTWYVGGQLQPDDIVGITTGLRHWMGTGGWGFSAALRSNVTQMLGTSDSDGYGFLLGVHYAPMRTVTIPPPPPGPVTLPPPVPAPVKQPEPVAKPVEPQELRVDNVEFEKNSARVTNIAKALLDDVALRMRQEPAATAVVTGYADNGESMGTGDDLDRRRAESVRDYLVSRHNIDASRISIEAGGATDSMDNNMIAVVKLLVR